jgi:hypothetical protein
MPRSLWLKALGYRLVLAGLFFNLQDSSDDESLSQVIRDVTRRVERKAVLITMLLRHDGRIARRCRAPRMDIRRRRFQRARQPNVADLRVHLLASDWSMLQSMVELPRILRSIGIERIKEGGSESEPLEPANSLSPSRLYLDRSSIQRCNVSHASRTLKKEEPSGGSQR